MENQQIPHVVYGNFRLGSGYRFLQYLFLKKYGAKVPVFIYKNAITHTIRTS